MMNMQMPLVLNSCHVIVTSEIEMFLYNNLKICMHLPCTTDLNQWFEYHWMVSSISVVSALISSALYSYNIIVSSEIGGCPVRCLGVINASSNYIRCISMAWMPLK